MRAFIRIAASFMAVVIAGCGGSSSSPTPIALLYAVGQGSNAVLGRNVLSDGEVGILAVPSFATNPIPIALALTPSKNFLYVANSTSNTVSGFNVDHATGDLTPVGNAVPPTPVGTMPVGVGANSSSQFLYVLNQGSVAVPGSSTISIFSIDSVRGLLTAVGSPVPVSANPQFLLVSSTAALLFVSGGTQISAFAINSDGTLSAVAGSPFTLGTDLRGMVIDPKGQFLYAADRGANSVASFSIQSSGVLSPVAGSPFPAGTQPVMVAIDSTGTFLYTANTGSNDSSGYKTSSGTLMQISGSPFATAGPGTVTATAPAFVAVDATNQFLYFGNTGSRDISGFSINLKTGALTAVTNSPFAQPVAPQWILSTR